MVDGPALLELREITKDYPGVHALDCVSVAFRAGEVHAIVGENGAGKSTLIKAITGAIHPSSGTIAVDGEVHGQLDPIQALRMGICAVYQEFNLVPYLSVAENVFYGREISKGVLCDFRARDRADQADSRPTRRRHRPDVPRQGLERRVSAGCRDRQGGLPRREGAHFG